MPDRGRTWWPIISITDRYPHHTAVGKIAQIQPGQKVLELACGYPLYRAYSHLVEPNGIFVALDIDEVIQSRSQKISRYLNRLAHKKTGHEYRVTANARELPFVNGFFDTIIVSNLNDDRDQKYADGLYRVLKPGGKLITSYSNISEKLATNHDRTLFRQTGFTISRISKPTGSWPVWNYVIEAVKPAN